MLTNPPVPYDLCVMDPIPHWETVGSMHVQHSVLNVKAVVAAFNQEKALVGAFSVITNLRMELFEALAASQKLGVWKLTLGNWIQHSPISSLCSGAIAQYTLGFACGKLKVARVCGNNLGGKVLNPDWFICYHHYWLLTMVSICPPNRNWEAITSLNDSWSFYWLCI